MFYIHIGFYSNSAKLKARNAQDKYEVEMYQSKNSRPLEANILLKNDSTLMVDNEEFRIINNNKNELTAIFVDQRNVIVVVLNASLGVMLYNKTFTNASYGKQNGMSFIGRCIYEL